MNNKDKCSCDCGCDPSQEKVGANNKKILTISWQRLIEEGETCPRCGSTEKDLGVAVDQLKEKLRSLDIVVVLEKKELSLEEFKQDPIKSNRILFNGRPLEDIIGAKIGQSRCCNVCGEEDCRTVEISGTAYETIPFEIIVKAGLKVGADL